MRALKESRPGSIFPLKLFIVYVVSYCLLSTIAFFADFGDLEGEEETWNADLELSLILCLPLLWVIISAVWHFKRMPIFAAIMILIAMFPIGDTLGWYFSDDGFIKGFPPGFELSYSPLGCLIAALVWCVPFFITYLIWRFWPRSRTTVPFLG